MRALASLAALSAVGAEAGACGLQARVIRGRTTIANRITNVF
jgi:hypothetical protein